MYHEYDYNICKLIERINLNLINFGHAIVNSEWHGRISSPVYSRLYYIADGNSSITPLGGKRIRLEVGKWYLIPAGCSFDYECFDEMEHYYFHLKLTDFDGTDILRRCEIPLSLDLCEKAGKYLNAAFKCDDIITGLGLKQTAFSVVVKILSENKIDIKTESYSGCIMNAIKYIKENLSVHLTISEIAEKIFVSKSTLTKHFKNELTMTVNEYIYDLVMSKAEYMLTSSSESIQAISEKFGFYDQFHFSRHFKEKLGCSPLDYRGKNPV